MAVQQNKVSKSRRNKRRAHDSLVAANPNECSNCGEKHHIFSNGGVEKITKSENIPYLGSIPLKKDIMECADKGKPYASHSAEGKNLFGELVKNIFKELNS